MGWEVIYVVRLSDKTDDDVLAIQNYFLQHLKKAAVEKKLRCLRDLLELLVCDLQMIPMYSSSLLKATGSEMGEGEGEGGLTVVVADIHAGVFHRMFEMRLDWDKKQFKSAMQIIFQAIPDLSSSEDECDGKHATHDHHAHEKLRSQFALVVPTLTLSPLSAVFERMKIPRVRDPVKEKARAEKLREKK